MTPNLLEARNRGTVQDDAQIALCRIQTVPWYDALPDPKRSDCGTEYPEAIQQVGQHRNDQHYDSNCDSCAQVEMS